jgi:hypothetical protein
VPLSWAGGGIGTAPGRGGAVMTGKPDEQGQNFDPDFDTALAQVLEAIGAQPDRPGEHLAGLAASVVDGLAADLARIESALADAAHAASRYGVTIGTDGRPPPVPAGPAADASAASQQHWALAYRQAYERAMAEAKQARQHAASQLMALHAGTGRPPYARAAGAAKQTADDCLR